VDRIHVPETRRRQKLGSLAGLEKSIKEHGLLHPLIVDDDLTLIAGARRLEAVKRLGFIEVEVRRWGQLTEEERDAIEVQENVCREDLDPYEKSARRWREMRSAAEAMANGSFGAEVHRNPKGGG
jgi:ParB family chromosome partitioning protein